MNDKEQKIEKKPRFIPIASSFSIVSFLAKYWQTFAIVGLLVGIYGYYSYRTNKIESLTKELFECNQKQEEYAQIINKQNERIKELVEKGRIEAAKFNALKSKIESSKLNVNNRINQILSEPKPKTCDDAIKYLIDTKKELAWPDEQ